MKDVQTKYTMQEPDIKARFDRVYAFAKQTADKISHQFPSVVFVALVGAWARGVPSDEDIDFVISSSQEADVGRILAMAKAPECIPPFDLRTTFICYPFSAFQDKAFSNRSKIPIIRIARIARMIFRKLPLLKKTLIYVMGPYKVKLQKLEILPQTIQTYIPFYDKNNTLATLQKKQRQKLEGILSESDLLLYSQDGFQKLISHYLSNTISKRDVKTTLLTSDIEWREYLRRIIELSNGQAKESIKELCEYVLAKN